jgi:hypothetical protein
MFTATLAASVARTTGANGTPVAVPEWVRRLSVLLDISASATDAADTLDVYVDALIGAKWVNAAHFTQQAGNGAAQSEVAILDPSNPGTAALNVTTDAAAGAVRPAVFGSKLRARWAIVDGLANANQSHTFSVEVVGA